MSYFDDASLVMIPSGYKTSKVYSVKPTSGDGDLTFTRSNDTATRVGHDGLIEKVRTNVILQSNTFSTTWTNVNTTETIGQAGYDGTNNAWLLDITGSTDNQRIVQSVSLSGLQTFSIYAKAGTLGWMRLRLASATSPDVYFDLVNGALGGGTGSGRIEPAGNGFYRCSIFVDNATTEVRIHLATGNGNISQTSGNIIIQNAQLEAGDIATDYIVTTTAAVSVGPVANVPRLDYLNSSCPRLLLEPQRTNLLTYSEQLDNAAWTKANCTVTTNQTESPSGYVDADLVTTTSTSHALFNAATVTASTAYTFSFYVKRGTMTDLAYRVFNLSAGTDIVVPTSYYSQTTASGWSRITLSFTTPVGCTSVRVYPISNSGVTGTVYFWGAQLEAGAYATSYIPTLGAAVTRGADAARTASGVTSIFNSTWTAFGELVIPARGSAGVATGFGLKSVYGSDNIANWVLGVAHSLSTTSAVDFVFYASGSAVKTVTQAITYGTPFKFAVTSDGVVYVNGVQVSASSSLTPATPVEFGFGRLGQTDFSNGEAERVAQALLFKSILPASDLAALTA